MRASRAIVAAVLFAISLAAGLGASVVDANPSAAADIQAWQWNIFGTCDTSPNVGNCGSTRNAIGHKPEDYLEFLVLNSPNRPWTIALNEVCGRQKALIAARLQQYGYTPRFAKGDGLPGPPGLTTPAGVPFGSVHCGAQNGNQADRIFGNTILVLGSINAFSFPPDLYYQGSTRNYSCLTPSTFLGARMGCVTHLDNANSQSQDDVALLYTVNFTGNYGHQLVLGADRNREDHRGWPSYLNEFDTRATKMKTFPSNSPDDKIDWIYAGPRANHIALPPPSSDRVCIGGAQPAPGGGPGGWASDHCLIWGTYRI